MRRAKSNLRRSKSAYRISDPILRVHELVPILWSVKPIKNTSAQNGGGGRVRVR